MTSGRAKRSVPTILAEFRVLASARPHWPTLGHNLRRVDGRYPPRH